MARRTRLTDSQRRAMFAKLSSQLRHPSTSVRRAEVQRALAEVRKAPLKARLEVLVQRHPRVAKAIFTGAAVGFAGTIPFIPASLPLLELTTAAVAGTGAGVMGLGRVKAQLIEKQRQKFIERHLRQGFTRPQAEQLYNADLVRRIKGRGIANL